MSEEVKEVARRLFAKLTRENKSAVTTVGIGKAVTGKAVLIAYCNPDVEVPVPELFEGYMVLKGAGRKRQR